MTAPLRDKPVLKETEPTHKSESWSALTLPINKLQLDDPLEWIRLGWGDFLQAPKVGLFFGFCFLLMGHALLAAFERVPAYALALSAGFLVMGPFLCLGLYDISRQLRAGEPPSLRRALFAWLPTKGTMGIFAGILLIFDVLWGRASLIVFALSFDTNPTAQTTFGALFRLENIDFIIGYLLVAALFAGLIFVSSAIAIPMILDKRVNAVSACLTSIRACIENPITMTVWAALIVLLIAIAMLPFFLGLLVIGPVLGHGTWHAHRALVYRDAARPVRVSV
jgi:uncharacterized membrane protein